MLRRAQGCIGKSGAQSRLLQQPMALSLGEGRAGAGYRDDHPPERRQGQAQGPQAQEPGGRPVRSGSVVTASSSTPLV